MQSFNTKKKVRVGNLIGLFFFLYKYHHVMCVGPRMLMAMHVVFLIREWKSGFLSNTQKPNQTQNPYNKKHKKFQKWESKIPGMPQP